MSNVQFENAIPTEFIVDKPASTSRSILRKNLMEYLPSEQTTFSPTGNNIMRFQIASNSDILSGPESYFRFVFEQTTTNHDSFAALDVGGAHALFKTIEIRALGSGILIQRYDAYNKWNAIQSLLMDDPAAVENNGWPYGDSLDAHLFQNDKRGALQLITGTGIAAITTGIVTGTSSLFTQEVEVGDELVISSTDTGDQQQIVGRVTAVSSNTALTITPAPILASTGNGVMYVRKLRAVAAPRARAANGTSVTLTLKPNLSVLQHYLPLFLLSGGIEISFELETAGRAMYLLRASGLTSAEAQEAMGYQITSPRFYGMMVTPHPDIVDEHIRQWQSPEGLIYEIPSVRYRRWTGAVADQNVSISLNPGVRSGRKLYMVIQDSALSEGSSTSEAANSAHSTSLFLRDLVTSFQVRIGSSEYPNRALVCDADSFELREQLKQVCGNSGACRLRYADWREVNLAPISATAATSEAKHFIFGVDLSRDNGINGALTGTDLSVVPLSLEIERSAAHNDSSRFPGSPVYHCFVVHDSYLKISSEQMSVMN